MNCGAGGTGTTALPRMGDPELAAPIPLQGDAGGGLCGGLPGEESCRGAGSPSWVQALGPRSPVPLPALPAPCARAGWRGVLRSRLAGEIPLIATAGAASFLCVGGRPGRRPGAGHTAPGCARRGEEGQTSATALGRGAAPARASCPHPLCWGGAWGRGAAQLLTLPLSPDDPDQPDADRVRRRSVRQAHPGAAGRWVPGGQAQPRRCSGMQTWARPWGAGCGGAMSLHWAGGTCPRRAGFRGSGTRLWTGAWAQPSVPAFLAVRLRACGV